MRNLGILMIGVCLCFLTSSAMANQAQDEATIRGLVKELFATWNAKDLDAHFALIDNDFVQNGLKKGKVAHREYLKKLFSGEEYTHGKLGDEIDIGFLTPEVAIYRAHGEDVEPSLKWEGAWFFSRKSGNWLLSAFFWWPADQ